MSQYRRHGDVNLHPITKEQFLSHEGTVEDHEGNYILAHGEATGSVHVVHVKEKGNLTVKDLGGRLALAIENEEATVTHTHDHNTISTPKEVYYVQVPEREIDWFAEGVERPVID